MIRVIPGRVPSIFPRSIENNRTEYHTQEEIVISEFNNDIVNSIHALPIDSNSFGSHVNSQEVNTTDNQYDENFILTNYCYDDLELDSNEIDPTVNTENNDSSSNSE